MIPFLFAQNNLNYAQKLDSSPLKRQYDSTETISDGSGVLSWNIIVHKSSRQFSPIIIDQTLEQANVVVKADGGKFGVTGDPAALRRWMGTRPEVRFMLDDAVGDSLHSKRRY